MNFHLIMSHIQDTVTKCLLLFNFWVNNLQKVKESERERVSPPPNRVHLFTQGKKNIIFTVLISFYVVAKHQKGNNKNKAFMKILDEN